MKLEILVRLVNGQGRAALVMDDRSELVTHLEEGHQTVDLTGRQDLAGRPIIVRYRNKYGLTIETEPLIVDLGQHYEGVIGAGWLKKDKVSDEEV